MWHMRYRQVARWLRLKLVDVKLPRAAVDLDADVAGGTAAVPLFADAISIGVAPIAQPLRLVAGQVPKLTFSRRPCSQ